MMTRGERASGRAKLSPADIDAGALATFCERNGIRRLALFGSALRGEMGRDSDVDLLVAFEPDRVPGLIRLARMERELAPLFGGREVELRTYADLSCYFRDEVGAEALTLFGAGLP
jgi:hypothetical protein